MGQTSSLDVNDLVNHTPLPSLLTPYDAISAVFVSVECRRLLHPGPGPEQTHVIRRRIDEDTRKLFRAMGASDVEAIVHEMNGADGFAVCLAGGGALGAITGRAGGGDLDLFVDSRGSARALVTRVLATGRYAVVDPDGGHVRLGLAPTDWEPPTPRSSSVVPTGTGEGEAERRFPLSMTKGGSHAPHLEIGLKLVQRAGAGGGPTGAYDRRTVAGTTTRIAVSPIAIDVILLRDLRAHQKASTCAPLGWSSRPGTACPGRRLWSFDLSVCATAITPRPAAGTADFHLTDVMAVVYRSLRFVSTRTSPGRIPHSRRQHVYHVLRQERRLCALAGTPGLPGAERWALAIDSLAASQREESGHAAGLADPGPWPNPAAWHSALDDSHELQADVDTLLRHYESFLQFIVDCTRGGGEPVSRSREGDTLVMLGIIAATGRVLLLPTSRRAAVEALRVSSMVRPRGRLTPADRGLLARRLRVEERRLSCRGGLHEPPRLSTCSQAGRIFAVLSAELLRVQKYESRAFEAGGLPPVFTLTRHLVRAGVGWAALDEFVGGKEGCEAHGLMPTLRAWLEAHGWTSETVYQTLEYHYEAARGVPDPAPASDSWSPRVKESGDKPAFLGCPRRREMIEAFYRRAADAEGGDPADVGVGGGGCRIERRVEREEGKN